MTRYIFGYVLGAIFLLLLFGSDLYLTRTIKNFISSTNDLADKTSSFRPFTLISTTVTTLLLWLPPFLFASPQVKLEYRLMLTIAYWLFFSFLLRLFMVQKTSLKIAKQSWPALLAICFILGLLLAPALAMIRESLIL